MADNTSPGGNRSRKSKEKKRPRDPTESASAPSGSDSENGKLRPTVTQRSKKKANVEPLLAHKLSNLSLQGAEVGASGGTAPAAATNGALSPRQSRSPTRTEVPVTGSRSSSSSSTGSRRPKAGPWMADTNPEQNSRDHKQVHAIPAWSVPGKMGFTYAYCRQPVNADTLHGIPKLEIDAAECKRLYTKLVALAAQTPMQKDKELNLAPYQVLQLLCIDHNAFSSFSGLKVQYMDDKSKKDMVLFAVKCLTHNEAYHTLECRSVNDTFWEARTAVKGLGLVDLREEFTCIKNIKDQSIDTWPKALKIVYQSQVEFILACVASLFNIFRTGTLIDTSRLGASDEVAHIKVHLERYLLDLNHSNIKGKLKELYHENQKQHNKQTSKKASGVEFEEKWKEFLKIVCYLPATLVAAVDLYSEDTSDEAISSSACASRFIR